MKTNGLRREVLTTLAITSAVSAGLLLIRIAASGSYRYTFLLWNLALAWVPLAAAWGLTLKLQSPNWRSWRTLSLGVVWLMFLPNSFYLVSDFVHLHATYEVGLLYDAALLTSFAFSGLALGFTSLYLVHRQLISRLLAREAALFAAGVLLLCSFAIYLGRYQRWNSWDVLFDPAGLLFDLSDQIINPAAHTRAWATTGTFFALLGSMYFCVWRFADILRRNRP